MSDTEQASPAAATSAQEKRDAREQASSRAEPRFSRERLLSPDGPRITGHSRYVIVGALDGDDGEEFTRAQIVAKIDRWHERQVGQDG